jgi:hypothetical protein
MLSYPESQSDGARSVLCPHVSTPEQRPQQVTARPQRERRTWRKGARTLYDRVPTTWLITGCTGLFLGISAVFGGLDDAPVQPAPVIEAGDSHAGAELTVAVNQALLIDAFPEQYLIPKQGDRLLVVRAVVENTTPEPRRLSTKISDTLRVGGVPGLPAVTPPRDILVIDDGSDAVTVQPGVPVELAFVWVIAADAVVKGDDVTVQLMDRVRVSDGRLTYGGVYADPVVGATVDVILGDVGAGVSG